MSQILQLKEQRAKAWDAAKKFLDEKSKDGNFVSGEDAATYDKMEADVVALGAQIDRLERQSLIDAELSKAIPVIIASKANNENIPPTPLSDKMPIYIRISR